jgi:hypothetical protein
VLLDEGFGQTSHLKPWPSLAVHPVEQKTVNRKVYILTQMLTHCERFKTLRQ